MSESDPAACPRCGTPISAAAPGGLCTRCLLVRFALGSEGLPGDEDGGKSPSNEAPLRIGDYDLLEVLGRGGMGVVYKARQRTANRMVAVKLVAAGELASPELIRRFKSEAETAASLEHPGIVPVYEVGESDGRHFFSMQWIAGESLAARLQKVRRGAAPAYSESEAAALVEAMARAVHYAHERGVLHRDIKPGNILLDERGEPRLTDFGLAKLLRHDTSVTRPGGILGTPAYMAPEQAAGRGGGLTTAVDVYGLGVVLYELLTGVPPFTADTSYELIRKVMEEEPGLPTSRNPRVGADLETVCLKCLEKDPARRYATARALAEDLERWRRHEPISARRAGPGERLGKWSRRHPALAVLSVASVLGFLALFFQQQRYANALRVERDVAREAQRRAERTVQSQRLVHADRLLQSGKTADALTEWARILREDPGQPVAAARIHSTLSHRNFVLPVAGSSLLPMMATSLEFSPDGSRAIRGVRGETVLLDTTTWKPVAGTPSLPITASRVAWHPDGQRVALVALDAGGVLVCDARTLERRLPVMPLRMWSVPVFVSGGEALAVAGGEGATVWEQDLVSGAFRAWNGDGREGKRRAGSAMAHGLPRVLVPTGEGIESWPLLAGGGERVFARLPVPPRRLRTRAGDPTVVVETGDSRCFFLDAQSLAPMWPEIPLGVVIDDDLSPNGLTYVSAQRERWGQLWDLASGKSVGEPSLRPCLMPRVRFTRDGRHLMLFGDPEGTAICDARNGRMTSRAFRHAAAVNHAEFSPDGRWVVTASDDGTVQVRHAETGEARFPPLEHGAKVRSAQFMARGTLLLSIDAANRVRVWDAVTGVLRRPPWEQPNFVHAALIDDTGQWLACFRGSGWAMVSLASPSMEPVHEERGDKMPVGQFSADGRTLLTLAVTDELKDRVRLWTPGERQPRWEVPERVPYIRAAMSEDTRRVAVVGPVIRIWDVATSRPVGAPMPRKDEIWVVAFRRDGRRLLTAGADRQAQIWDAETGEPAAAAMLHDSAVWQAQFSPDGTRVLTSTSQGMARLWDVETGHPLTEPFPDHPVAVHIIMSPSTSARFSPDGRRVVLPCADDAARFVELPPSIAAPEWLPGFVEAVAGQRWGAKGQELLPWSAYFGEVAGLASKETGGRWLEWVRWLVADRLERPLIPGSDRGTREHVEELVREGSPRSLVEALQIEPQHQGALSRLSEHWSRNPDPALPGRLRIAEHLKTRAERISGGR